MMKYLKKGDKVIVIAGNEKGKVGEVLAKGSEKVLVKGVNIRKRHRKVQDRKPTIIEAEAPLHISNVAFTPDGNYAAKLRCREKEGKKEVFYLDQANKPVVHRTF
jgi:large subunit ribosomal protein L24